MPGQQSIDVAIEDLHLDPDNPRLPEDVPEDESELLGFIYAEYDVDTVARSISEHGYFPSEPLIVVKADGKNIVVEGNRRLAALRLLTDVGARESLSLDEDDWSDLVASDRVPQEVPVIIAASRSAVAPIIGYRHISGIEPWDPWAKARFIASLVDREDLSFDDVASLTGEGVADVRAHYRNYGIVEQAEEDFKLPVARVVRRFGVFTRAMTSRGVRTFIAAPASADVEGGVYPLPDSKKKALTELWSWVYGDESQEAVITDSRQLTELGTVLESRDGLKVLRGTRSLEEAFLAAGGIKRRLVRRLDSAAGSMEKAAEDVAEFTEDQEVVDAVDRCRDALDSLMVEIGLDE